MKREKCLNLVDFQIGFVGAGGKLSFDNGKGDLNLIKRMKTFFKLLPKGYFKHGIVNYDTHIPEEYAKSEEAKKFVLHCDPKTRDWHLAINPATILEKIPYVQNLKKNTYDMWAETIDKVDERFLKEPQDVTLIGVASDICNRASMEGWLKRGAKVTIIDDLTRGIFKETEDVVAEPQYKEVVESGMLRVITMKQFFNEINYAKTKTKNNLRGGR